MTELNTPPADPPTDPAPTDPPPADPPADPPKDDTPPAELGDAGKQAIDRMKEAKKAAEAEARETKAALAALQAKLDGKEAEHKAEQEAQRVQSEALAKADERILKAEVRAAAAAKLADPADALKFIDLSEFEVGSDGEVDSSAIAQAIDDLITSKPYLASASGGRFQGSADAGARNDAPKVTQLSRADLASMSPEQIDEAHTSGRLDNLMAGK